MCDVRGQGLQFGAYKGTSRVHTGGQTWGKPPPPSLPQTNTIVVDKQPETPRPNPQPGTRQPIPKTTTQNPSQPPSPPPPPPLQWTRALGFGGGASVCSQDPSRSELPSSSAPGGSRKLPPGPGSSGGSLGPCLEKESKETSSTVVV